jgi:long-chain acyl-CoA synthetase
MIPSMNLATAFRASAETNREKTAIFWGDSVYSYDHLNAQSDAVAHALKTRFGVVPGDRVAIWVQNCPEFISAFFGIQKAGAVVTPINNFLKPDEVCFILGDAGCRVMITDSTLGGAAPEIGEALPELETLTIEEFGELPVPADSGGVVDHREPTELAVIIYTSGTTGRPKGAMLTHGNLLHNIESCRKILEAEDYDRFVLLLPMFHSFMLTVCNLLPLLIGGSIVLIRSLHPPKNVMLEIVRHKATILPAIPAFFRAMLHDSVPADIPLRAAVSGAAPLPVETLNVFSKKFPFPLIEGYGLSEASPVVSFNPLRGPWIAGSIGKPVPDVEVSVRNEAGEELPDDEIGEICVRGGNVMAGYWNNEEETKKAIREDWLYTGDIGYRRADGFAFITDRKKDMLLVNGINVYPREIEEVIYQIPGVKEAAVIGKEDPRRGEMPIAFVAPDEGVELDEKVILAFLKEKLAAYKIPRKILMVDALPRNATGKILKTELRNRNV